MADSIPIILSRDKPEGKSGEIERARNGGWIDKPQYGQGKDRPQNGWCTNER